jgi:hypothetical protein
MQTNPAILQRLQQQQRQASGNPSQPSPLSMTLNMTGTPSGNLGLFGGTLGGGLNNNSLLDTFSKPMVVNSLDQLNYQMS